MRMLMLICLVMLTNIVPVESPLGIGRPALDTGR